MIPKGLTDAHIKAAARYIDRDGIPPARRSRYWQARIGRKLYPIQYVIFLAAQLAKLRMPPGRVFVAAEAKRFLEQRGYTLVDSRKDRRASEVAAAESSRMTLRRGSNAGSDWKIPEQRAAISAYLEMQQKERVGEKYVKKDYYRALSKRFGRAYQAFEFRMCNISYVLSLQGRAWLPGLLPRKNVGPGPAEQIERLLAETEGRPYEGLATSKLVVQSRMKRRPKGRRGPVDPPQGNRAPKGRLSEALSFVRDLEVRAWVLSNADGVCECCRKRAPFVDVDGIPFLEVHHLQRLADGGTDTVDNAIAACPNCHRQLHYGKKSQQLTENLKRRIERLRADSGRAKPVGQIGANGI